MQKIIEEGFGKDHRFVMNLFGWNIFTSNLLPDVAAGAGDGTNALSTAGKANMFFSVADDNQKPVMSAWRRMPKTESERNKDFGRDEFISSCRYGFGIQRKDSLGILLTNATAIA
jgi:hypothetical protein